MKSIFQNLKDSTYVIGLILVLFSTVIFAYPVYFPFNDDGSFGLFGLNFFLAVFYFLFIWITGKLRTANTGLLYFFVFLVLFLISAYSLNRILLVFELSAGWLSVLLILVSLNYLLLISFAAYPRWLQHLIVFILGVATVLFIYLSIYLFPFYPISILLLIGLAVSAHSFVPLLISIFTIKQFLRYRRSNKGFAVSFSSGIIFSLLIVFVFILQWRSLNKTVNDAYQESLLDDNTDLPAWIKISQKLPDNLVTEKYLKSQLVYSVPDLNGNDWWSFPSRNFDEVRKHDPLVMVASLFSHPSQLSATERIKILETVYDARHKTQERLWSGANLKTMNVISNIRLWPGLRVGYTEKTITVSNIKNAETWQTREEAIYTFHLPEGSVVTALSLWINGKEEKGILTTRSKADSAYKTIVGVESRDPSVVHWQEGNTVSVRVFPVNEGESRVFKIGITSPLAFKDGMLTYENIWFEGPDFSGANEMIKFSSDKPLQSVKLPGEFKLAGNGVYTKNSNYDPVWEVRFKEAGLENSSFVFNNSAYQIISSAKQVFHFDCRNVYLDVNFGWSSSELEEVYSLVKDRPVFVYDGTMVQVNEDNRKQLFKKLAGNRFSLFPFFEITDPARSLVITKGTSTAPNVKDLKGTEFAVRLEAALKKGNKFQVYGLDATLSPYLKTLKEHRVFNYEEGGRERLSTILSKQEFSEAIENENQVDISNSNITIIKTSGTEKSTAPDHLMRLFAYNHLMSQLGSGIFTNQESNDSLVSEAQQACIVSPVSSLVVLETQADYDRFNISKSKNSLENASLKSKGAVPEPHEWALIILGLSVMLWVLYNERCKKLLKGR
jgi:XrtN system VIT domain protein